MMVSVMAIAAPAYPGLITVTQSDGTQVSFYLHGDEYFSYMTSTDGYLLARNDDGIIEYGDFSNGKFVVPTGVAAHNELNRSLTEQMYVKGLNKVEKLAPRLNEVARQRRMKGAPVPPVQKATPWKGNKRALIILVGFSDLHFTKGQKDFEKMANQENYSENKATGSIRDYFKEVSFGQFTPTFDVYGPYTLPHKMEYYGADDDRGYHDVNARDMIVDACNAADNDVDFSLYDNDGNGTIDNVFVYYAGGNQAEGGSEETVWPHRSSVYGQYSFDDKLLRDYACTSEFKGNGYNTPMCGIGSFCHEFSHVVGLPDFYDTGNGAGYGAMAYWDIMTSGNYNNDGRTPPTYTAYERFYIGWLTPQILVEDTSFHCEGAYRLKSLISSNSAYLISKTEHNLSGSGPDPSEFFMLEYRKKEGRDTYSGLGEGMLITHVVYNAGNWAANGPNNDVNNLGYEIVLPTQYSVRCNDYDCYPGASGTDFCQFFPRGETEPLRREVINIIDYDTCCEFDYIRNVTNLRIKVKDIDAYDKKAAVEEFEVNGEDIEETVSLSFKTESDFSMRRKGDSQFVRSLTLTPDTANKISEIIEVQYSPKKITYDEYMYNKFMASGSSGKLNKFVEFRYRSRRPVYITTPVANDAANINGTSFTANWSYVNDTIESERKGAKYYLDLYTVSNEFNTEVESFENFPEMSEGWRANFTNEPSTTYKKEGNQSVVFETSNDTLWTKEYLSDVKEISFWVHSINANGTMRVDGLNYETGEWGKYKSFSVDIKTDEVKTINIPGFRQFRISYKPNEGDKGKVALDCFEATTESTTKFICKNQLVTDTFYNATGLTPNTSYMYVVRATDKDNAGRYENVSENSNEIVVETNEGGVGPMNSPTDIALEYRDGVYVVHVAKVISGYSLFVYTVDGRMVKKLPVTSNEVYLPEMYDGIYVLKYTKDEKGSRKDGVLKMYYSSKQ